MSTNDIVILMYSSCTAYKVSFLLEREREKERERERVCVCV